MNLQIFHEQKVGGLAKTEIHGKGSTKQINLGTSDPVYIFLIF